MRALVSMTKVWVVSGFVLMGTGLALALFGWWLSGNTNCDAADLGRACVAASLGLTVVGASLAAAGWLRVQRLGGQESDDPEEGGLFVRRPGLVMLAFSVVGLVLLAALIPSPHIPVDVYATSAPVFDTAPSDLLPPTLAGHSRTALIVSERSHVLDANNQTVLVPNPSVAAEANYDGGVFIRVTRFNATNLTAEEWEAKMNASTGGPNGTNGTAPPRPPSVANASRFADDFLGQQFSSLDPASGPRECVRDGVRHWFAQDGPSKSQFAWREGNFVFEVFAPTKALRDSTAAALG
jgi:hypothetical protein